MSEYIYTLKIKVRDYELDSEGIVNNANYLHYLEYTRHEFCEYAGFSFKQMQQQGIVPVLNHIDIDYKTPLKSGDTMESKLWIEMKGVRFIFHQDIYNATTGALCIHATVSCVCINNEGKLTRGEVLAEAFKKYLE